MGNVSLFVYFNFLNNMSVRDLTLYLVWYLPRSTILMVSSPELVRPHLGSLFWGPVHLNDPQVHFMCSFFVLPQSSHVNLQRSSVSSIPFFHLNIIPGRSSLTTWTKEYVLRVSDKHLYNSMVFIYFEIFKCYVGRRLSFKFLPPLLFEPDKHIIR